MNEESNKNNGAQSGGVKVKSGPQDRNVDRRNDISSTLSSSQKKVPSRQNSQNESTQASGQREESPRTPALRQNSNDSTKGPSCQISQADFYSKTDQSGNISHPGLGSSSDEFKAYGTLASSQGKESLSRTPSRQNSNQSTKGPSRQNSQPDVESNPDQSEKPKFVSASDDKSAFEESRDTWQVPVQDSLNEGKPDKLEKSVHVTQKTQKDASKIVDNKQLWKGLMIKITVKKPSGEESLKVKPNFNQSELPPYQFILEEKVDDIKNELKNKDIGSVTIKKSPPKFEFSITTTSKEITSESVKNMVMDIIGNMTKLVVSKEFKMSNSSIDMLEMFKTNLSQIEQHIDPKTVHVYYEYENVDNFLRVITVGMPPGIEQVFRRVQHIFQEGGPFEDSEVNLGTCSAECFRLLGFPNMLERRFPQMRFEIDERTGSIRLHGSKESMDPCKKDIQSFIQDIYKQQIDLKPRYIKLIQNPEIVSFIYRTFRSRHLCAAFEVDVGGNVLKAFAKSRDDAKNAIELIKGCFREEDFEIENQRYSALNSGEAREFLKLNESRILEIESNNSLTIVSSTDVMEELMKIVLKELHKMKSKKEERSNENPDKHFIAKIICRQLPDAVVYLMKDSSFKEAFVSKLNERISGASVISGDNNIPVIKMTVIEAKEKECVKEIDMLLDTIPKEEFELDAHFTVLFELEAVKQYISEQICSQGLDCYWYTDKGRRDQDKVRVVIKAKRADIAKKCADTVASCVQKREIGFGEDYYLNEQIKKIVNKYKNRGLFIWDPEKTDHLIICTSDAVDDFEKEVQSEVERFIRQQSPGNKTSQNKKALSLFIRKEKLDYLHTYMIQQISEIERKYQVDITRSEPHIVLVKGFEKKIDDAVEEIDNLCNYIDVSCVAVSCKFATAQSNGKYQPHMIEMAEKNKCCLKFEFSKPQAVLHLCHWKRRLNFIVINGRTTDIPAEVVICPTNRAFVPFYCSDDLLKYDPELTKVLIEEKKKEENQIHSEGDYLSVLAPPVFSCHYIAYTAFQHENSIKDQPENVVTAIQTSLQTVLYKLDQAGVKSVAIPMQILDYVDVAKQLDCVWAAVRSSYCTFSSVSQVYICFPEEFYVPIACKHFENNLSPGIFKFDLHHMIDLKPMEDTRSYIDTRIVTGSLINHKAEALVNTCDIKLDLSKGRVSAQILEKAGYTIQEECNHKHPAGIDYDEVATTSGGRIEYCKVICHGALPPWSSAANMSLQVMKILIWQCLTAADARRCSSIAFPALGTGQLEYPYQDVAETMFDVIEEYAVKNPATQIKYADVVVYDKDEKAVQAFKRVEKQRKNRLAKTHAGVRDSKSIPEYLLETTVRLPNTADEICIQVLPDLPKMLIGTQMEVRYDPNLSRNYEVKEVKGVMQMSVSLYRFVEQMVEHGLLYCHSQKFSSIAFFLDCTKDQDVDKHVKKIKDTILAVKSQPYLKLVQVYIKDEKIFEIYLAALEHQRGKQIKQQEEGGIARLVKRGLSVLIKGTKETLLWRKKNYTENNGRDIVAITGNPNKVCDVKRELVSYLKLSCEQFEVLGRASGASQIDNKYNFWYRIDKMTGQRSLLPETVSKRLDFAVISKEKKVDLKDWIFDMQTMTCYEKFADKVYSLENSGTTAEGVVYQSKQEEMDPVYQSDIRFRINQKYLKEFNDGVVKILGRRKLSYDKNTFEVTASYNDMIALTEELKTMFGLDNAVVTVHDTDMSSSKINSSKRIAPKPSDLVMHIELNYMDYKMLQFFCPDCQILQGKPKYENGKLSRKVLAGETEKDLKETVKSKLEHFQALTASEIHMQDGFTIDDTKLSEVQKELLSLSPDLFSFRSKDKGTLILKGSKYEILHAAKTKCEFILGIKKPGRGGRGARVIATDTSYDSKGDGKPSNKSFSQSMKSGRSQYSQEFSGRPSTSQPSNEMTFKTPEGIVVKVYVGNILNLNVEAIVNAANENLMHGGGVADVISRAAGYKFQQESDEYIRRHGPIPVGECCKTSAGNLQYKYVIHAVGPKWFDYPQDKRACAYDLKRTIESCFYEADTLNLTSVALPAISSGIFGVPKEVCCSQYCQAVIDYSNKCGKTTFLKEIHFMDKDSNMISMIQSEFGQCLIMNQLAPSAANAVSSSGGTRTAGDTAGRVSRSPSYDPDKYENKQTEIPANIDTSERSGKFQEDFKMENGLKITIIEGDITQMNVDIIVCPQDTLCKSRGGIAKAIESVSNDWYTSAVKSMKLINKCEVKKIKSSPSSLPFNGVLHTVPPLWDKNAVKDNAKFERELALTIRNIIQHCSDSSSVKSVAIPVLGVGIDGLQTPYNTFATKLCKEIVKATETKSFSLDKIMVVTYDRSLASAFSDVFSDDKSFQKLTSFQRQRRRQSKKANEGLSEDQTGTKKQRSSTGDPSYEQSNSGKLGTTFKGGNVDDCVICMDTPTEPRKLQCGHVFCANCIGLQFKVKPVCPTCGAIQGIVTGDQPPGTMNVYTSSLSVAGYSTYGRIDLEYHIYSGYQGKDHPEPGKRFEGFKRTAYLPDNERGRKIAKMLEVAFKRKLIFTIGHSRTTGKQGVVTWNDVHHKTNPNPGTQFGYPDETYLDRVTEELAVKGVTEKDI